MIKSSNRINGKIHLSWAVLSCLSPFENAKEKWQHTSEKVAMKGGALLHKDVFVVCEGLLDLYNARRAALRCVEGHMWPTILSLTNC